MDDIWAFVLSLFKHSNYHSNDAISPCARRLFMKHPDQYLTAEMTGYLSVPLAILQLGNRHLIRSLFPSCDPIRVHFSWRRGEFPTAWLPRNAQQKSSTLNSVFNLYITSVYSTSTPSISMLKADKTKTSKCFYNWLQFSVPPMLSDNWFATPKVGEMLDQSVYLQNHWTVRKCNRNLCF